MPFGVVSGVGRGMGVLDGVQVSHGPGEGRFAFFLICLNDVFECIFKTDSCMKSLKHFCMDSISVEILFIHLS